MAGSSRPNLVRADTIDLQDQDAPSASEHNKHLNADGVAPHQAAQFQHVQEERRSEEETLADAWNMAGQHTGGQSAAAQKDGEPEKKGEETDATGGEGEEDTDGEDDDDDMMDRMSSSPSIGDGAFPQLFLVQPAAERSFGRPGTPQHAESIRATFNQSPEPILDSSPFVDVPQHMPLQLAKSCGGTLHSTMEQHPSSSFHFWETSPSPFTESHQTPFEHHRLQGRYEPGFSQMLEHEGLYNTGQDEETQRPGVVTRNDLCEIPRFETRTANCKVTGNAFAQRENENALFLDQDEGVFNLRESAHIEDDHFLEPLPSPTRSSDSQKSDTLENLTILSKKDDDADTFHDSIDRCNVSDDEEGSLPITEDIDFEFVYALHTFVATVEGQANATKGDTMVLLDDSNSYWWLVRVVKDSSIGYLPAEHIETPTERLARLNKHRNIDLSQTMLGDNPEKTRNPLKKAMRRRTAKTVQFAAPTYVEASDYDYSTEDEDAMVEPFSSTTEPQQQEQTTDRGPPAEVEERNAPEEANVHATRRHSGDSIGGGKASFDSASGKASIDSKRSSTDDPQLSPRLVDRSEAAPLKSRKGTPRNADSFLKDDSIETRKISLTPGLLRDDSAAKAGSTESARTNSFESLVKTPSPQEEKSKRDSKDKKKDKKGDKKQGGMLSGLFKSKKKDKKSSSRDEGEMSDMEKVSAEMSRGSPQSSTAASGAVSPVEQMTTGPASLDNKVQTRAKLQKTPPSDPSRMMSPVQDEPQPIIQPQQGYYPPPGGFIAELEGSQTAYEMATGDEESLPIQRPEPEIAPPAQEKSGPLSPIAAMLRSNSMGEPKPQKAKRSKRRVELDDFDEPEEEEKGPNPFLEQEERSRQASQESDRLSASPVEIVSPTAGTFMHGTENVHIPEMNVDDDEDDEEEEDDEAEEPASTNTEDSNSASTDPSFIEKPTEPAAEGPATYPEKNRAAVPAEDSEHTTPKAQTPQPTTAPTPTRSTHSETDSFPSTDDNDGRSSTATAETPISSSPQRQQQQQAATAGWDDANLRAWFDADDVKDMLAIIQHSSKVPGSHDDDDAVMHPSMQGLFDEQRKGVEGMMGELDGLLGGLLRRKGVVFT